MATIATLVVDVVADTKKLNAGLTSAQGGLSKFGLMAGVAAGAAGVAILKFGADAVNAASDLNESLNKVNVVFGDSSKEIIEWSETAADSFGISQQAALESAGTFGNLFDAMKIASSAGAEMSTTLVELAADLASFNNASPEDVLAAMQSGLTGQIRPLRQYGIEISEAALQQEALAQGITKSTSQMTMAEKVQLRYALILKQTGNAQGDFARTSNDLANMQRRAKAQWEDVTAQLGTLLLPVVLRVTAALNDLATVVLFLTGATDNFSPAVKEAAANTLEWELGIADFALRLTNGIPIIGSFVTTTQEVSAGLAGAGEQIKLTDAQLALLNAHITAGSTTYTNFRKHWNDVADTFLGFIEEAPRAISAVEKQMNKIPKAFRDTGDALLEEIPAIRGTVVKFKEAFDISPKEMQAIAHHWAQIARTIAHDLRVIGDSDLKPAMREAIAALPPEMRNAWVEGNARQRSAIEKSIQTTYKIQDQMPRLAREALQGGTGVGQSMAQGIAAGINAGAPFITAAATRAVQNAIMAARRAAEAHSPSKKMVELGHDLMEGLKNGIDDKDRELVQKITDSIDKMLEAAKGALSDFRSKMNDFAGGISGGFGSFMDITGAFGQGTVEGVPPDIASLLQTQLSGAQNFADILDALQRQGASKALLSQIAGAGPESASFAQALLQGGPELIRQTSAQLQEIRKIAHDTGRGLSQDFFGEKMDRLRERVDRVGDLLAEANRLESGRGGDIALQIDGKTFARITRDQLNKLADRNVTAGVR